MILLSDVALACPGWLNFEVSGVFVGLLIGIVAALLMMNSISR